jgi:DNA-binding LytR/AlgR family response regulator
MILKAYRDGQFHYIKARDFAVFKADSKYVIGITPDGREFLLSDGSTLKSLETVLPDLIRINRGVLVKRSHVTGLIRSRKGGSILITVVTTVGEYKLARRSCVDTIVELIEHNLRRERSPTYPMDKSPDEL